MRRLDRLRGATPDTLERFSLDDLANQLKFGGITYPLGLAPTWANQKTEEVGNNFLAYAERLYKQNGIVFACVGVRVRLFSEIRFQFQRLNDGRPGDLFNGPDLDLLANPWPGATTGDLTARMEQDSSLAGNSYTYRGPRSLKRLRPDWVTIIIGSRSGGDVDAWDAELAGFAYQEGGPGSGNAPVILMPETVAHYAPVPDPTARYRGMSWMTPVLNEITSDGLATEHKRRFFEHAATPNMIVTYPVEARAEQIQEIVSVMKQDHEGVLNAYKTLHMGGGADPKVVGTDLKQIDFKAVQGAGETRIAAASGIAPIVAGFSEGLDAATYSNYGQARRHVGDLWARPAWRSAAGALQQIIPAPENARLWYDASDVSFLQEDEADAAAILKEQMLTIESAVRAGYTPDSAKAAITSGNLSLLEHTGLFSVQLQPPGTGEPAPTSAA